MSASPTPERKRGLKRRRSADAVTAEELVSAPTAKIARMVSPPHVDLNQYLVPNLPGAEVYYIKDFVTSEVATQWYAELDKLETWYHPTLKVYGRPVQQSRSIAAYATSSTVSAKYSGHQVDIHYPPDIPAVLSTIWDHVSERLGMSFNHIMLNRYADGNENIGRHRDTKENGVIASLSLGAVRTFIMTPNKGALALGGTAQKWQLANGSLLVMSGKTQDNWKHEIPKEPKVKDGRISLTFRQMPASKSSKASAQV